MVSAMLSLSESLLEGLSNILCHIRDLLLVSSNLSASAAPVTIRQSGGKLDKIYMEEPEDEKILSMVDGGKILRLFHV